MPHSNAWPPSRIVLEVHARGSGTLYLTTAGGEQLEVLLRPSLVRLIEDLQKAYDLDRKNPWKPPRRWGWRHPLDLEIEARTAATVKQYITLINKSVQSATEELVQRPTEDDEGRLVLRKAGTARLVSPVTIVRPLPPLSP